MASASALGLVTNQETYICTSPKFHAEVYGLSKKFTDEQNCSATIRFRVKFIAIPENLRFDAVAYIQNTNEGIEIEEEISEDKINFSPEFSDELSEDKLLLFASIIKSANQMKCTLTMDGDEVGAEVEVSSSSG